MTHHLKSYPEFFAVTISGEKTHEVRSKTNPLTVDGSVAPFNVGDIIEFHEFEPTTQKFSGRAAIAEVTWFDTEPKPWLDPDYMVMSFRLIPGAKQ